MTEQTLPDRIDFTLLSTGEYRILKLRHDTTANPRLPRDIPLPDGVSTKPADFNLAEALDWCRKNGYAVREITGSARAWLGTPWPIRSRHRIKLMRQQAERYGRDYQVDFAYDG